MPAEPGIDTRIRDLLVRAEIADDTLVMEVDVAGSAEQLWQAITDPAQLARWSPVVPDRPLTSIGPALSRENPEDDPVAADVLALAGEHAVTHRWGDATLGWVIDEGQVDLQVALPEVEQAQFFAAGWQVCLAVLEDGGVHARYAVRNAEGLTALESDARSRAVELLRASLGDARDEILDQLG